MTVPDPAAVQIAAEALAEFTTQHRPFARAVLAALARRFAFVERAELAALRAELSFRRRVSDDARDVSTSRGRARAAAHDRLAVSLDMLDRHLDTLPPATAAPAVPPSEDVQRLRNVRVILDEWAGGKDPRAACAAIDIAVNSPLDAVPAGPQPAGETGTIADVAHRTFPFRPAQPDPAARAWWGDEA